MISQLAEKDAELAGCKAKLTEQEEYITKMKEQSEKGKYVRLYLAHSDWSGSHDLDLIGLERHLLNINLKTYL